MSARRSSAPRVIWILLGGAVLAVAGSWAVFKALEAARWARLERRVSEIRAELDARCGPRPVLRGAPVPGNAWDEYVPAIDLASSMELTDEFGWLQAYAGSPSEPDFDRIRPTLTRYQPALDRMRSGTHRAESRRVQLHEREQFLADWGGPWLQGAAGLAYLGSCRARLLASEGKTGEATELLLDVAKFGQDVTNDGSLIAYNLGEDITRHALLGMEALLNRGRLSAEDARQMDRELGRLDSTFPRLAPWLLSRLDYFGSWALSGHLPEELRGIGCVMHGQRLEPGWRELFSERLMKCAAFERSDGVVAQLLKTDELSYTAEFARRDRIWAELDQAKNWVFRAFAKTLPSARPLRGLRTRLRMVRGAAHYRATGEFLDLEDPLGTKLLRKVEGDRVRIWGVGENGSDDGGLEQTDDIAVDVPRNP